MSSETAAESIPDAALAPQCRPLADWAAEIAEYDAEASVATWDGPRYRMTYRIRGSGPPLVVVPGIASTHHSYAMVLNRLATDFRTICYDYPGDQRGDRARLGKIRHSDLAADLIGLLDYLSIQSVFALGVSFGSTVLLSALAHSPARFQKAAVQGAFAHRRFSVAERAALALGRFVPGCVASLPLQRRVLEWNTQIDFPRPVRDRWPLYCELNGRTPIAALAHRCDLVSRLDLRGCLPNIHTSVLVIQGNEDRLVPKRLYEEVISLLPRARGCVLPVVGHPIHVTHPEREAQLVAEYFRDEQAPA